MRNHQKYRGSGLVGHRFGRLLVTEYAGTKKYGGVMWRCTCDCGKEVVTLRKSLRSGDTKSCGCWMREVNSKKKTTHGKSFSPEYKSWASMVARCTNPENSSWPYYGGAGIKICSRWRGERGFINFLADMGEKPTPEYTIEREDNTKNYEPSNCRWATKIEQQRNRTTNVVLTLDGKSQCISAWAEELKVSASLFYNRKYLGWSDEKCLTTPVRKVCRTKNV